MTDAFMSASDAAEYLDIPYSFVTALCREKILEAEGGGKGKSWRIYRSSVEEFLERSQDDPDPDDLADLAEEIKSNKKEAQEAANQGEESFLTWLAEKTMHYGPGALRITAGVALCFGHPEVSLICEGLAEIITKLRDAKYS